MEIRLPALPPEPGVGSVVVGRLSKLAYQRAETGWVVVGRMVFGGGYGWLSLLDSESGVRLVHEVEG